MFICKYLNSTKMVSLPSLATYFLELVSSSPYIGMGKMYSSSASALMVAAILITLMFLTSSEVAAVILQDTTPELGQ